MITEFLGDNMWIIIVIIIAIMVVAIIGVKHELNEKERIDEFPKKLRDK